MQLTSKYKPEQQIALFKRFAQEFINAAIQPLLDDQRTVDGTCECIPIVEQEQRDHPVLVTLATMSIAKDYYEDFKKLRRTSELNLPDIMPIKEGLMKNIRTILVILSRPTQHYGQLDMADIVIRYISKIQQDHAIGTDGYNERLKSALKCYRSIYSLTTKCYYGKLSAGTQYVSALLVNDDKNHPLGKHLWSHLDDVTEAIRKCELSIVPDPGNIEEVVETLRQSLTSPPIIDPDRTDSD